MGKATIRTACSASFSWIGGWRTRGIAYNPLRRGAMRSKRKGKATMQDGQSAIATLLQDLVRIDSINPSLVPGAAGEAAIAGYIAEYLRAAGFTVYVDE